jgi:hypothetical protein
MQGHFLRFGSARSENLPFGGTLTNASIAF